MGEDSEANVDGTVEGRVWNVGERKFGIESLLLGGYPGFFLVLKGLGRCFSILYESHGEVWGLNVMHCKILNHCPL